MLKLAVTAAGQTNRKTAAGGRKQQERYPVSDLQLVDTIRKTPTAPGAWPWNRAF